MVAKKSDEQLNERAQHFLKVLINRYVREGHPVGSRTLSKDSGLELSAATVRNVMSDLEELGFVSSPHTSAGRIPTEKGFRFFVDTLLNLKPLAGKEVNKLQEHLDKHVESTASDKSVAASASALLSGITHLAGVVTIPKQRHAALRQIEFLPLSDNRVLAILVLNAQEVQNRILHMDRAYTEDELRMASNYLNEQFAGRDIADVRRRLLKELQSTQETMNRRMLDAINIANQVFQTGEINEPELVLAGETNLMEFAELSDVDKLRRLFDAFSAQRDILHLLDRCLVSQGVQIFIGQESGYQMLDECSVVTSPYKIDDEVVGVLGVIGPTRMAYERVIPIVDVTARLLGSVLNSRY